LQFLKEILYSENILRSRLINAAFTLSGCDDQERNLTFVKTAFQVLKLQFLACSMENTFLEAFLSVPGCQTCMYKRGIRRKLI